MAVATALHPSRETTATILQAEVRLVAAHVVFTPVLSADPARPPGTLWARVGQDGAARTGWVLPCVHGHHPGRSLGNFGFIAPVLAAESPASIDAINVYLPEVALNAVGFGGFVVGFILFGMAMVKTATLPRSSGLLVAVGAPIQVFGFALAQTVSSVLWILAILGSVALGVGVAWPGYQLWQHRRPDPRSPAAPDADRHHATRSSGRAASP
jgi:hypothetical protein